MFGGNAPPKLPVLKPRPVPKPSDCFGNRPYTSGHFAREPNTQYNLQLMQYNQRKTEESDRQVEAIRKQLEKESITAKYTKHNENKSFQRSLKEKVQKKLQEYEVKIDERRKKLTDILWKEERELVREIVTEAQNGKERKIQEKIEKVNKVRERNEAERLEIVKQKKMQQYINRCAEFRTVLSQQRMAEAKQIQIIQIQENEARRQSEKELENMWHEMKLKYIASMDEREEQDRLYREKLTNEFKYYVDLQNKEKLLELENQRKEMLAEGERLDNLRKQMAEEDRINAEKDRIKKKNMLEDCKTQMREYQEMLKRIEDKERKIQAAYDELADQEIEREKQSMKAKVTTGYQDMINYKNYLAEIKKEKDEQTRILDEQIQRDWKEIQRIEDEKKCKDIMARQAFQQIVLKERAKQIEEKKKKEEELQKAKDLEMELVRQSREHNDKLRKEFDRQNILKAKKYAETLQQQMEYSRVLEEREKENLRRILEAAKIEDEIYNRIVAEVLKGDIKISQTHAFRQVINAEKCPCPKPIY